MKYLLGSNQYETKRRGFTFKGYKEVALICLVLIPVVVFGNMAQGMREGKFISPIPEDAYADSIHVTPQPQGTIPEYIRQVFGQDAPKAFKLLSCENQALNPNAVNDNTAWGGVGQDIGIFQINTVWQGVTNKAFLYDWKINIDIAHNIYTRDGNTFKLWTCGRKLGI